MMSKEKKSDNKKKKTFELDITYFEEMQDVIFEYFYLCNELLGRSDMDIKKIWFNIDSNKIRVEAVESEEDSEESTEPDFEWV